MSLNIRDVDTLTFMAEQLQQRMSNNEIWVKNKVHIIVVDIQNVKKKNETIIKDSLVPFLTLRN